MPFQSLICQFIQLGYQVTHHIAPPYKSGFLHMLEFQQECLLLQFGRFFLYNSISNEKYIQQFKMFYTKEGTEDTFFAVHKEMIN